VSTPGYIIFYHRLGMLVHKKTATAVALTGTRRYDNIVCIKYNC